MGEPLKDTVKWFEQARESAPTAPARAADVQFSCMVEEFAEILKVYAEASKESDTFAAAILRHNITGLHLLANYFRSESPTGADIVGVLADEEARIEVLDGFADLIVTVAGCAYLQNTDITGALKEVNRSNFSKFEEGKAVYEPCGKIRKAKDYSPPDLAPYVKP